MAKLGWATAASEKKRLIGEDNSRFLTLVANCGDLVRNDRVKDACGCSGLQRLARFCPKESSPGMIFLLLF